MTRVLRWIALLPVAVAGWYLAMVLGMMTLGLVDQFCPEGLMVSGQCTAGWYDWVQGAIFYLFIALSAVLVVLLAALIAPAHRRRVAWVAFLLGAAMAVLMALLTPSFVDLLAALVAGLATALWVQRARWSLPAA